MSAVEDLQADVLVARERQRIDAMRKLGEFAVQLDNERSVTLRVPGGALRHWRVIGRDLAATLDVTKLPHDFFTLSRRNRPEADAVPVTAFADRNESDSVDAAKVLAGLGV